MTNKMGNATIKRENGTGLISRHSPTTSEKDAKIHKTATAYREGMGGEERGGEKGGK